MVACEGGGYSWRFAKEVGVDGGPLTRNGYMLAYEEIVFRWFDDHNVCIHRVLRH